MTEYYIKNRERCKAYQREYEKMRREREHHKHNLWLKEQQKKAVTKKLM